MTRIAWKPHSFQIQLKGFTFDSERTVDGIICAEGFGIHTREHRVVVSHLASGKRLTDFATLGAAFRYVDAVLPYTKTIETWHLVGCVTNEAETLMLSGLAATAEKI